MSNLVQITVGAITNNPPDAVGSLILNVAYGTVINFTQANFTTDTTPNYSDPEGDLPANIEINTLPTTGTLYYGFAPVIINQKIPYSGITGNNFYYAADVSTTTAYTDTFNFSISDEGSGIYTSGGVMTINVAAFENQPPTIEDNLGLTTDYGVPLVITAANLSTQMNYTDPEGDPPLAVKVVQLANSGELRLNEVAVVINQIINWTDIVAGNLIFYPDNSQYGGATAGFRIVISDTGSGEFSS